MQDFEKEFMIFKLCNVYAWLIRYELAYMSLKRHSGGRRSCLKRHMVNKKQNFV